jgi:hypothetical protein
MAYAANGVGVQTGLSATTGAAVSLTKPTGLRPTHAVIAIESNSVRYTTDGTTPTASVGILLPAGTFIEWLEPLVNYSGMIDKVQFIGISGTATIQVDFRS